MGIEARFANTPEPLNEEGAAQPEQPTQTDALAAGEQKTIEGVGFSGGFSAKSAPVDAPGNEPTGASYPSQESTLHFSKNLNKFRTIETPETIQRQKDLQKEIAALPETERESPEVREIILSSFEIEKQLLLGGGVNGCDFIKLKDDGAGVFKSKDAELGTLYATDPNTQQAVRVSQREHIPTGSYWKREIAAYLLDHYFLKLEIVPVTVARTIDGHQGSFQDFIKGGLMGMQVGLSAIDELEALKLWLFDIVIWNTDRHDENFLVKDTKIYAIDNGLSFGNDRLRTFDTFYDIPVPAQIQECFARLLAAPAWETELRDALGDLIPEGDLLAAIARIGFIGEALAQHGMIPEDLFKERFSYHPELRASSPSQGGLS